VALGLVAALVAGGFALSLGLGSTGTAAKAASVRTHQKPKVRTIHRTIKIHRKAKSTGGGTVVLSGSQSGSSVGSSSGSSSYSESETDDSHESDDSSSEDGAGGESGGDD
jgi:hypothetical protein